MKRWSGLIVAFAAAVAAAWWAVGAWRDRAALDAALEAVRAGRFAEVRPALTRLAEQRPGDGAAAYALGVCERELGRPERAVAAWQRVSAESPYAGRAALMRAREALAHHRFAESEPLLERALREPGAAGVEARATLAHIYKLQGRLAEVVQLFRDGWAELPNPNAVLKELWRLQAEAFPADEFHAALTEAARQAPDDDRVRLGQANLAIRTGNLSEADRRLRECEAARPRCAAVRRARIAWAIAADRPDAVAGAVTDLPAAALDPVDVLRLRAWLARGRGDAAGERRLLEALDTAGLAGTAGLDRLAELALARSDADVAARLRARKAELDRALPRYHDLLYGPRPEFSAEELAALAESLGWASEARHWWTVAARSRPGDPSIVEALARLQRRSTPPPGAAMTDLAADLATDQPAREAPSVADAPRFEDAAEAVGLAFRFDNGRSERKQLPETMSGGVALLDYDGDGWLDVYAVQGGPFPPSPGSRCADRLFRNRGGTFEDVSERAGLAARQGGYGHGVTIGDIDNDGHPDVFVTRWRSYALYRNRGDGTFEDVTEARGLAGDRDWPTSAALADLDGDGDLDLYVAHYCVWDEASPAECRDPRNGRPIYCPPVTLRGQPDHLYRNEAGRFIEVPLPPGELGRGLGVVAADLDGDGRVDLFVADDMDANRHLHNLGDLAFEEVAAQTGLASNADGGFLAGMGIASGDLDGDGLIDLAVTNFYGESTRLYRNLGHGQFADHTSAVGLAAPSRYRLGFGAAMLDSDNDGRLDLLTVNGHVDDLRPQVPWSMPAQLMLGTGGGRLVDVTDRTGSALTRPMLARGLAVGDLDNDGRLDAVVVDQAGPLALWWNRTDRPGHFAAFALEGDGSNRDGVGAVVEVEAGGRRWTLHRVGGGSYQSANDPRLHVGLGAAPSIDHLRVRWPSGRVDEHHALAVDRGYHLREKALAPLPLPGFGRPPR